MSDQQLDPDCVAAWCRREEWGIQERFREAS
jgi:hypothetical protein